MNGNSSKQQRHYPLVSRSTAPSLAGDPQLQIYLNEIRQFKVLSREEMSALAVRFQEHGDFEAGRRLVMANLRLVVKIATDFQVYWRNSVLDLIQEGNIGLMRAVKMFNPHRGVKFSFYAAYWIKAYILRFIMNNWRLVKITTTETMRTLFFNLHQEKRKLAALGVEADNKALAERLQVRELDVEEMGRRLHASELSMDTPLTENSPHTLEDLMASQDPGTEEVVANRELRAKVRAILSREKERLNPREVAILEQRLMTDSPKTLQQLSEQFHITRQRIGQIEVALMAKIRAAFLQQMPDYGVGW